MSASVSRDWVYVIELSAGAEPLLRALGAFPVQGAEVTTVRFEPAAGAARLEVVATGLDELRAGRLRARLGALTEVRTVGVSWAEGRASATRIG